MKDRGLKVYHFEGKEVMYMDNLDFWKTVKVFYLRCILFGISDWELTVDWESL